MEQTQNGEDFEYRRVILVTGSGTGIGYALARALASHPVRHTVYLSSRYEDDVRGARDQLKKEDADMDVKFVVMDVTDEESLARARDVIEKAEGRLDTLVNNAGLALAPHDQSPSGISLLTTLRPIFDVNFFGLVAATTTFLPLLRKAKADYASIVNISSDLGSLSLASEGKRKEVVVVGYRTSKAAVNAYTVALANEMKNEAEAAKDSREAARDSGSGDEALGGAMIIKVNTVTPGTTSTRMNHYAKEGRSVDDAAQTLVPWCLLGPGDGDKTGRFWGPDGEVPW